MRTPGTCALLLALALPAAGDVSFTDVTSEAGIRFEHENGAFGEKYLPETMGAGVVFLDFDGDGWQDLFLVNSKPWPGHRGDSSPRLYRNDRDGTFTDVTRQAGLQVSLYGMGATAADYDADGDVDLFVTALGPNALFRNEGDGRFTDVTAETGVGGSGFSTAAAFFDYDSDGQLDLFVANYVEWSIETDIFCTLDGQSKSYCTPESYQGQSPTLWRNLGDGRFEDVTKAAGLYDPTAKSLGVALIDYDADGHLDLLVANDTQPNKLYHNLGDGRFSDEGLSAGIAFGETGVARAGMGVDAADYSGSGRASILIGNFSNEMIGLYHNEGNGLFLDEAPITGVGQASLPTLAFAAFFFDYDLDGRLDIFAANGHVADDINLVQPSVTWAQAPHLFRNLGDRRFEDVAPRMGGALTEAVVARGAAYADYDLDGDLDIAITENGGPARLLRNDGGDAGGFVRIRTEGVRSNRSGIGARVTVQVGERRSWRLVHTASSYCSQSELPLVFGLGGASQVDQVEVAWPSGQVDRFGPIPANRLVRVREGEAEPRVTSLPARGAAVGR